MLISQGSSDKSSVDKLLENPEVSKAIKNAGFDKLLKNPLVQEIFKHPVVEKFAAKLLKVIGADNVGNAKANSQKISQEERFFNNLKKAPIKTLVKLAISKTCKAIMNAVIKNQPNLEGERAEVQQIIKNAMKKGNLQIVRLPKEVVKVFTAIKASLINKAQDLVKKNSKGKTVAIAAGKVSGKSLSAGR